MCSFCDLLILLLQFNHIILKLHDFFFFWVVDVLHLDDPILEDFI